MNITEKQIFLNHLAQTSNSPLMLEIVAAKGIYLYDKNGKEYIDLISGISVSNIGHNNEEVIAAIKEQADKYSYLMVYGEYILSPQVNLAKLLVDNLPNKLNSVYFVNSGSEAIEGAMKLAKRYTLRTEIIAFKNAYHGSTQGALSILGDEQMKNAFRPLLPDIKFLEFNNFADLERITDKTACVITETIQSEAGIILPEKNFLQQLQERCNKNGTLLVIDEVQNGVGRCGSLFAFEQFNIVPDIICLAKGFGGGMPLGAFISSKEIMNTLSFNPALGHITTFGGHPISCSAGYASLQVILRENLHKKAINKGILISSLLKHKYIKEVRGLGLFWAVKLDSKIKITDFIKICMQEGIIIDGFLFDSNSFRISPPLIITEYEITSIISIIKDILNKI